MKINPDHKLELEPDDTWNFRFEPSPNSRAGLQANELILYATGRASVENAASYYKKSGQGSVHLLIGKDGLELAQLVPFNRQAQKKLGHDRTSIAVALDYYPSSKNQEDADPRSYLVSIANNNKPYRVALFPPEQLDALLELAIFLQDSLNLDTFLSNDEILVSSPYPGPAFPITRFREKLFERTGEKMGAKIVLEEVIESAVLRNAPDPQATPLTNESLKAKTPVSILSDWKGWVRVEVMEEIDNNPWLVGWLEERQIQSGIFEPEIRDNLLYTKDGRRYKFIPALDSNYDKKRTREEEDINFVVMHITTGTQVQSSINHFRSASSGVSAHLIIGRDGRVIQMVPFNHSAYHAGSGIWEGQGSINHHSIGIEVDNAGELVHKLDGRFARRTTIIPESQVQWVKHWKSWSERPWHKFTPIQLGVTQAIVIALKKHYQHINELLEHERISLLIRSDPGPLFPMKELRQAILGREEPIFKVFRTKVETNLYENANYTSPDLNVPTYPSQLPECTVEVLRDECAYWTKIKVIKCEKKKNREGKNGWVRKNDVKYFRDKLYKMTRQQDFYRDRGAKDKPPCFLLKTLPEDTPVRVQKKSTDGWSLIATPEHKEGYLFLEGWVRTKDLEEVVD